MSLIAAGLLTLAGWTAADCAVTQNFMAAVAQREERRQDAFGDHCHPFGPLPDEPAACTEWRAVQGLFSSDKDMARAEEQLGAVLAEQCQQPR